MTDVAALMRGTEEDLARAQTGAMRDGTELLKEDWREAVRKAGLGERLALTIRGQTYPQGTTSLDPATWVYAKAPRIIDAFAHGPTIYPTGGRHYLALATENVPRKRRRRMTPVEVEAYFDQDLVIRPGRGSGNLLAFVDVLKARSGRGFRRATPGRLAQGRRRQLVLMFVLTPAVKLPKLYDLDQLAARAQARYPDLLAQHMSGLPDRTAPIRSRR